MKHIKTSKYSGFRRKEVNSNAHKSDGYLFVNSKRKYQQVLGFGGAFTEASAVTLNGLSLGKKEEVLRAYFDPLLGLGYTLGRVSINSCDFSLDSYSYVKDYDLSLESFTIARDLEAVIPMIVRASKLANQPIQILASPWSPPAWMKTNGKMTEGGKLKRDFYEIWANYFIKFIDAYHRQGINLFAVTVQNEPAAKQIWESCLYTPEEESEFVKKYLGPALVKSKHNDVKLLICDHNRDMLVEHAGKILEDKETAKYVWGTAFHWYVSEAFDQLSVLHNKYPQKHLLFTEGCIEGGVRLNAFESGERYIRNMIGDFGNYCEGYIDWNLVLDENGGPNHVGNYCDAPVICDTKNDIVHYNVSFDAIAHFSCYVKPGAYRIESVCDDLRLKQVAFLNPDNSKVLIIQNETEEDVTLTLTGDSNETLNIERRSFSTLCF